MIVEYVVFYLLIQGTTITAYGIAANKDWFWFPRKAIKEHFVLSCFHLINEDIQKLCGKKGVVFYHIAMLSLFWVVAMVWVLF